MRLWKLAGTSKYFLTRNLLPFVGEQRSTILGPLLVEEALLIGLSESPSNIYIGND